MYNINVSANNTGGFLRGVGLAQRVQQFESQPLSVSHSTSSARESIIDVNASPAVRHVQIMHSKNIRSEVPLVDNIPNIRALPEINEISKTTPGYSGINQQPTPYKLTMQNSNNDSKTQDPLHNFIFNVRDWAIQDKLFDELARKDLPHDLRNLSLTREGNHVMNLVGILAREILPEDEARFNRIGKMLKKGQGNLEKEQRIEPDLKFLLQKYGKQAANRQVDDFIECCRQAWSYYNPGEAIALSDHDIFKDESEFYQNILKDVIDRLILSDRVWVTLSIGAGHLRETCTSLAFTIKIKPVDEENPKPVGILPDSFYSKYPNQPDRYDVSNASQNNNVNNKPSKTFFSVPRENTVLRRVRDKYTKEG